MKLKNENYSLKSENLIKQQSLEKNALSQKVNSEFEEMAKVKQIEMDKIITKYKNKKFELETKQGKEKNLHDNENLLKANIFNSNLISISNNETLHHSMSKSINKITNKTMFLSDPKLKEIAFSSKRTLSKANNSLNNGSNEKNNNVSDVNNKGNGTMNKTSKLLNSGNLGLNKPKPAFVRNLQYSSAQN